MTGVLIQRLFDTPEFESILDFALQFEWAFQKSGVIGDPRWRESRLCHQFAPYDRIIRERVRAMVPALLDAFGLPRVPVADIEAQMTAHNDGEFFKRHRDIGHASTNPRMISYVYYFWREPRAFSGGEIEVEGTIWTPPSNSILFFPSSALHEVLPVRCPSRRWEDSRWTFNGWCRNLPLGVGA